MEHRTLRNTGSVDASGSLLLRQAPKAFVVALALLICPTPALARHPEVVAQLGQAQLLGEARYRVLAWTLFDAQLWAPRASFAWTETFALSITYRRPVSRNDLVSRSLAGMEQRAPQASRERLAALLRACFRDVNAGDRFTAVSVDQERTRFFLNGRQTCEIAWPNFRRPFFGIWLDAQGRDRAFSARLQGQPTDTVATRGVQ